VEFAVDQAEHHRASVGARLGEAANPSGAELPDGQNV
jgi:hypothetical protein